MSQYQGTNVSPYQGTFEDDFAFPQVGYVNSLEGNCPFCHGYDISSRSRELHYDGPKKHPGTRMTSHTKTW